MRPKKIFLVAAFVLVVALLFAVIIMARNQVGGFGREYDRHVTMRLEEYASWFTNRREGVFTEVRHLASDRLLENFIVAMYSGEDISSYAAQIKDITEKIEHARKIQILDPTGIVLYSTQEGEALVNRFVPELLTQAQRHHQTVQQPFLRFISTNEFIVVQPLQREEKTFQVVAYYDTKRFAHPEYGLMVPWGHTLLVGRQQKGWEEASRIVEYASVDPAVLSAGRKTIGGMREVDGIQVVYFSLYDRYVSIWVIGIIIFSFVLLFLILYAFFRLLQEEKLYKQPLTFRHAPREDLKDLVDDIEEGSTLSNEEARKGIEEMLMSEDIEDLTASKSFAFSGASASSVETPMTGLSEEQAISEADSSAKPLFEEPAFDTMQAGFGDNAGFDKDLSGDTAEFLEKDEDILQLEEPPSLSGVAPSIWKSDDATQFFANQDRLLDEITPEIGIESEPAILRDVASEDVSLEPSFSVLDREEPSSVETLMLEPDFNRKEEVLSFDTIESLPEPEPVLFESEPDVISLEETTGEKPVAAFEGGALGMEQGDSRQLSPHDAEEITLDGQEMPEISLEEISLQPQDLEIQGLEADLQVADRLLQNVPDSEEDFGSGDEVIALNMDELSAIPVAEMESVPGEVGDTIDLQTHVDELPSLEENFPMEQTTPEKKAVMFGEEVHHDLAQILSEPPTRLSTIHDMSSYAAAAHDIARSALNMNYVCVLEKKGESFEKVMQDGFHTALSFSAKDPLYTKILSKHKSLDIQNNLDKANYLKQWFGDGELRKMEELLIVPVVQKGDVVGVGIYGREKGSAGATDLQKSELYNIGFLQEAN